jgi:ribosomal-protein-alanine N-acetyltransferase
MIIESPGLNSKTAEILADIDRRCFEKDAYSEENWMNTFGPNVQVFFAKKNKKVIASSVWEQYVGSRSGYLISYAVLPDYRGQGSGEGLLLATISDATKKGVLFLFAHTRVSNTASQCLLTKQGFKPVSIEHNFYPDEYAIQWKLKL